VQLALKSLAQKSYLLGQKEHFNLTTALWTLKLQQICQSIFILVLKVEWLLGMWVYNTEIRILFGKA